MSLIDGKRSLDDMAAVMAVCRQAGLEAEARAARNARDWPTLSALYAKAKNVNRLQVAA